MEERRTAILEELKEKEAVYVTELAQKYNVSYETIRKDLAALEKQGLLLKSYGGATLKKNAVELPFIKREKENITQKIKIAKKALSLIPDNSSILISSGSTTLELAKLLSTKSGYKIFTDSLPIASLLLGSENQVFLFGGELRHNSSSVHGGWAISQIEQISVDLCFIGTDGFQNIEGPSSPSSSDVFVDQAILKSSEKKYVLGDSTKFMRKSLYRICKWSEINAFITDSNVSEEEFSTLSNFVKVIKA